MATITEPSFTLFPVNGFTMVTTLVDLEPTVGMLTLRVRPIFKVSDNDFAFNVTREIFVVEFEIKNS